MSSASEQVISGLEGVLACESSVAFIDGNIPELSYRGYNIHDIAETLTYEQVVYLLWHGELPSADQLRTFNADLAARRGLPSVVIDLLRLMPPSAHPMAGLRTAVSLLGTLDPQADDNSPSGFTPQGRRPDGENAHHRGSPGPHADGASTHRA